MKTDKKNGKLFLLIGGVLAAVVIGLNLIQAFVVSTIAKADIKADAQLQYEELAEQTGNVYRNLIISYFNSLDFYANSEVVKNGGSDEEIVAWMTSVKSLRNSDFEYVGFVNADGQNFTDVGSTSNVSDRDYFQAIVKKGADYYVDNPVLARSTGKNVIHACKAAKYNGRTIGMFYGIVNPEALSKTLNEIKLPEDCYVVIFGGDGTIVGTSVDDSVLAKEFAELKENDAEDYEILKTSWLTNVPYHNELNIMGEHVFLVSTPIEKTEWNMVLFLDEHTIFKTATIVTRLLFIGGAVLVFLVLAIVGIILYKNIKPLAVVESTIRGIATGDADLTKRIDIHTNNEIGRVVEGFNLFSEKLQTIIATMKDSKAELVDAGQMLSDSTTDTSAAITQIIANIESMGSSIDVQSDSVHQTAGAVNEIAANIESLNRMIESQSSSVTEASAAVEEMIGNINSVNSSVKKMATAFEDLERKTQIGIQKQNDVNAKIEEIERESQALQEANAVISGIAEQTNLLAMNAAIEAAHAGEAGKGFSVVADEIRKLSEDSGTQSQSIGEQLSSVTETISEIVQASQVAAAAFNEVSVGINSTTNLVREITNAMEEQNAGSQQISVALHSMNDTSNEVKTSSYEMAEGNKAILQEIKALQDATFSMKDGMTEMSAGARKINETGAALSELSNRMDESIKKIGEQVDQFKV